MDSKSSRLRSLLPQGLSGRASILVLVALFLLGLLFPYTHDDWGWGVQEGLDRLAIWFDGYNGRYVGNLLVIALTRSVVLRSAVVAVAVYALALCADRLADAHGPSTFWVALILFFCMPASVRAQGIVWTSGFTNYAVPAALVLVYFTIFRGVFFDGYEPRPSRLIPCFVLGFVNSLIVENVSLFNVGVSAVLLAYTRVRHKKWDVAQAAFLVGSIAGCALMFTNSAYTNVANGTDYYRSTTTDKGAKGMVKKFLFQMVPLLVLNNWAINAGCALIGIAHAVRTRTKGAVLAAAPLALMACVSMRSLFVPYSFKAGSTSSAVALFCGVLALASFVALLYLAGKRAGRLGQAIVVAVAALTAPLVVVNPIGPRCFLPTYFLLIVAFCLVARNELHELDAKVPSLSWALPAIALMLWGSWVMLFGSIRAADIKRVAVAKEEIAQGATSIEVEKLPHSELLHYPNPEEERWVRRFKQFYGLDEGVELVFK